jgi:hypothetical protein
MKVLESGETLYDTWTATANAKYFKDRFKVGDLLWLDGDIPPLPPETTPTFGYKESATAIIKKISTVNSTMTLIIERNQHRQKK